MVGTLGPYSFWFTLTRQAHDSAGVACQERALEIRSDSARRLVPLLYTGEAPVPESDSTVLVHLFQECRPGALYRVDLRSGQPTPVRK